MHLRLKLRLCNWNIDESWKTFSALPCLNFFLDFDSQGELPVLLLTKSLLITLIRNYGIVKPPTQPQLDLK